MLAPGRREQWEVVAEIGSWQNHFSSVVSYSACHPGRVSQPAVEYCSEKQLVRRRGFKEREGKRGVILSPQALMTVQLGMCVGEKPLSQLCYY